LRDINNRFAMGCPKVKILLLLSTFLALTVNWHKNRTTLSVRGLIGAGTQYLDVQSSHDWTSEPEKMKEDYKTAVVVSARYLTNCSAARLRHLVATTPPEIDVWFLHDHAKYTSNSSEVATSLHHLQSLMQSLRLQHAAKKIGLIPQFDTTRSGGAKSIFCDG
jgi:hypothetical protein